MLHKMVARSVSGTFETLTAIRADPRVVRLFVGSIQFSDKLHPAAMPSYAGEIASARHLAPPSWLLHS
jgi:hypothetical protein